MPALPALPAGAVHSPRRQPQGAKEAKSDGFEACESSLKRILEDEDDAEAEPKVRRVMSRVMSRA